MIKVDIFLPFAVVAITLKLNNLIKQNITETIETYLPKYKVLVYDALHSMITPNIAIENLASKFLWIMNVDH